MEINQLMLYQEAGFLMRRLTFFTKLCQYRRCRRYLIADIDIDFSIRRQINIHSRTKPYKTKALATLQMIAWRYMARIRFAIKPATCTQVTSAPLSALIHSALRSFSNDALGKSALINFPGNTIFHALPRQPDSG